MFNGKIHYKSPFSIAMLNYQRVAEVQPSGFPMDPGTHTVKKPQGFLKWIAGMESKSIHGC